MNKIQFSLKSSIFLWPAMILLAFGQATGELIHWPYINLKYELHFLWLLIPASILQIPMFYFLARQTIVSGESFFGLLQKHEEPMLFWAIVALFAVTTLWIGSYTVAGITIFTNGFGLSSGVGMLILFVVLISYATVLIKTKGKHKMLGRFSTVISIATVIIICAIIYLLPNSDKPAIFLKALFAFENATSLPNNWVSGDYTVLFTAFIFAGLGGLWNIFYSQWLADKNIGIPSKKDDTDSLKSYKATMLHLFGDIGLATFFNMLVIAATVFIVYSLWNPNIPLPSGANIISTITKSVAQLDNIIPAAMYILVGILLIDTWPTAVDGLSKIYIQILPETLKSKYPFINYTNSVLAFIALTVFTYFVSQPQLWLFLNGTLSIFGSAILCFILIMNDRRLIVEYPLYVSFADRVMRYFLLLSFFVYLAVSVYFLYLQLLGDIAK